MNGAATPWLTVREGEAPLIVSLPHSGTEIPAGIAARLVSPALARHDADWWIDRLYDFAAGLGATTVHTAISRTVIDVNRDPSGAPLYPGQAPTDLCPTLTFDGKALYRTGEAPEPDEIAERRRTFFDPYHAALSGQIARLLGKHGRVVLYDCHSIRSVIPRLFSGVLPHFNIGTHDGRSCDPSLPTAVERVCGGTGFTQVTNGRFKGGWITRRYGTPQAGVNAIQMELACRSYMNEPEGPADETNWPAPYDPAVAGPMRAVLVSVLSACLEFAKAPPTKPP